MKLIDLNQLKNDLNILKKYISDKRYMERLIKANNIIDVLEITNEKIYYQYQIFLIQLKGINYEEATFLIRINDKRYLNMVKKIGERQK